MLFCQFGIDEPSIEHAAGVWLREPVKELAVHAKQYDFVLSLLILDDAEPRFPDAEPEDPEDTFERFTEARSNRG